jgi:predicted AAA+ superfamily ATPase
MPWSFRPRGRNPAGFLGGLDGPVILDEIQRAPELFLAINAGVGRAPQPGRFLLTGSANALLLPRLADSLAGRMEILTLWALSQGEIGGVKEDFIDAAFGKFAAKAPDSPEDRSHALARLLAGGYPAALKRRDGERRRAWFGSYLTILQRDVRDLANIEGLTALPRLLALLAARSGSLSNFAELSRSLGMPQTTLKRYLTLLETTYLVQFLPAWSANMGRRMVKSPKMVLTDVGLIAYLLGLNEQRLELDPMLLGPLLESFVIMEIRKQTAWSRARPQAFHFRTQAGVEADLVLEDAAGNLVGIEVKASATVSGQDFKGLHALAALAGRRFRRGIVLYTGASSVPFGPTSTRFR